MTVARAASTPRVAQIDIAAHSGPTPVVKSTDFLVPRTAAAAERLKGLLAESAALNAADPSPADGLVVPHGIRLSASELGDLRAVLAPELLRSGYLFEELTTTAAGEVGALQVSLEPRIATLAQRPDFASMSSTEVAARLIADDIQSKPLLFRPDDRPLSLRPMNLWERVTGSPAQVQTEANYLTGLDAGDVFAALQKLLPGSIGEGSLNTQGGLNNVFFAPEGRSMFTGVVKQEQRPLS